MCLMPCSFNHKYSHSDWMSAQPAISLTITHEKLCGERFLKFLLIFLVLNVSLSSIKTLLTEETVQQFWFQGRKEILNTLICYLPRIMAKLQNAWMSHTWWNDEIQNKPVSSVKGNFIHDIFDLANICALKMKELTFLIFHHIFFIFTIIMAILEWMDSFRFHGNF